MKLNPNKTEKKSWTKIDKKGREETWEWEENSETIEALKRLKETTNITQNHKPSKNYQGPLYAPHPNLKKKNAN